MMACSVEERLKENMAKLERDWKIKGPTAANVIKRQPQVHLTGQQLCLEFCNVFLFAQHCTGCKPTGSPDTLLVDSLLLLVP